MELKVQKRLAADVMGCSPKRVWFDEDRLDDIKEAITKADIRTLVNSGLIQEKPKNITSKGRARHIKEQKRHGRRKGHGSRKGAKTARLPRKERWINVIRSQRDLIRSLKEKGTISKKDYRILYLKCKGGFFRSRRHISLYIKEKGLAKEVKSK